jgi:hypothetical protein
MKEEIDRCVMCDGLSERGYGVRRRDIELMGRAV